MSARQAINTIKATGSRTHYHQSTGEEIKKAFDDKEFIRELIETAIKNWDPKSQGIDVAVLLPEKDKKDLMNIL
jgi:hypothetical protein